jgi:hypothetical protein
MRMNSKAVNRRTFLKAAGVTMALPFLESLGGRVLRSGVALAAEAKTVAAHPMRMVCVGNAFGFYPPAFFPKNAGKGFDLPPTLAPVGPYQNDLTFMSGLDHGVKGGHFAVHSYLSGVRTVDAKSMPEGNITIDQKAAETVGGATRFPSLAIGSEDGLHGGCQMCWTRSGTRVPPIPGPRELFRKLFIDDSSSDREQSRDRFRRQGSILDAVNGDAKSLGRGLNKRDRDKLDEYFTSVRDVEHQLELSRRWAEVPKPKPGMKEPNDTGFVSDLPTLYDLIALAIQTDSTRVATLEIAGGFEAQAFGLRKEYHAMSHHGMVQENIDGLMKVEKYQVEQFARFIGKLKSMQDGDGTLLDHTMVLFGSGMGNANSHVNNNLPVILAGGGFKHGEHKAYPQSGRGRVQLCNLYVSMLQRFGVETHRFGLGSSTLAGLEVA